MSIIGSVSSVSLSSDTNMRWLWETPKLAVWNLQRNSGLRVLGLDDTLEKETATLSSILAWRIPWTEEPGRLQSMES